MVKHVEEIELTCRLLLALDCGDFVLNPSDRPDVDAAIQSWGQWHRRSRYLLLSTRPL